MSELARRTTMQPLDPYNNARSHLPVPSTVKKSAHHNGRMSMAGGPALRGPFPPPGTNPRHSMMRSQNVNPLLASASKPPMGRTPLHNSTRRGSMWMGGQQVAIPPSSQGTRDTRPLRDKQYQQKCRQEIAAWLSSNGYSITSQAIASLRANDFRTIYQELVLLLDPNWPFNPEQRFEDQFVQSLRAFQYPYINQIDLRWLPTPAAMHSWPTLLGMLHWMTEMGKGRMHYLQSGDATLQDPDTVPEEFDDMVHHHALAFAHYNSAYEIFLDGQDVYPEQERILEERYMKKDGEVIADLEQRTVQLRQLEAELKLLETSPAPIEVLKDANAGYKHDKMKFERSRQHYEEKKRKLIEWANAEKAELEASVLHLEKLKTDEQKLMEIVKVQNLSPEEVVRMNNEHETLSRDLENLKYKITENYQMVVKLEVSLTHKVQDTEEALDQYNTLLAKVELFPPLPPPLEDIDLRLDLNSASSNPQNLLIGPDVRKVVRPTLSRVVEIKRTEHADVESERVKVDDEFEQLNLECENMEEEVDEVMNKVNGLSEQADELREAAQREAAISNAEAARLERDLAQARTAAMANGVGVKSRLQALQIAYREQVDRVNRLKDDTVRAIIKSSSDIVMFKEEVSRQLQHLRDFAEAN